MQNGNFPEKQFGKHSAGKSKNCYSVLHLFNVQLLKMLNKKMLDNCCGQSNGNLLPCRQNGKQFRLYLKKLNENFLKQNK